MFDPITSQDLAPTTHSMFPHVSTNLTLQRSAPSFVAGAVMANCQMSHRFLYKRCAKLEGEKKQLDLGTTSAPAELFSVDADSILISWKFCPLCLCRLTKRRAPSTWYAPLLSSMSSRRGFHPRNHSNHRVGSQ